MLKARDGAKRAAEQALLHVIQTLGIHLTAQLEELYCPLLTTRAGMVGTLSFATISETKTNLHLFLNQKGSSVH